MKKFFVLTIILMMFFCFTSQLQAQRHEGFDVYLNFGIMTDDTFSFDPFLWYTGLNFDFHIGDAIMISPEANVITYQFDFKTFLLEPAVLLNFKLGTAFIGAGIGKYFILGDSVNESTDLFLKMNVGFSNGNLRFKVFANTWFDYFFKSFLIGVQLGLGF